MFVDVATLQDLEILATPAVRGTTLWSLVNRTRTRTGSAALRERFLNPPDTADEILALQRAHQVLAEAADAYRRALDRAGADAVERYLNATWQLPLNMPPLIRVRRWYRQYLQDVERGRNLVSALLESAADLRGRLAQTQAHADGCAVVLKQVRVCFVTGPNMAGKSTFLKATAVAVFLAHLGGGVPAASMEFAPVGAVFSSVQIIDNLTAGDSFYLAEVRRIGALAATLAEHGSAVAVIDEPFRGTNVHDAAEATLAIITRLAAHPAVLVFVASHVGEVVPHIRDDRRIAFCHFAADVSGDQPRFDYRLREGVSHQRLGTTLLRQEGILDRLEASHYVRQA